MKYLIFLCMFLGGYLAASCQTGKLTGLVSDSSTRASLELATISIFGQDSALITYQLSDKRGRFHFEDLPLKKKLLVSITYTGYTGYRTWVQLEAGKTDTLPVFLSLNDADTNAVVVTSVTPIRMNGDTLEINPAAFKMKEDAVVEELLNQISGITIWSDGTITVNGRKVEKLFVDGKPFLGSEDPRIATQNLPKTAIDKIQLYQEYDRSKIGKVTQPQDSLLTMNIKLKENSKKGYFGKAGAGIGTRERYEGDLSFQMYNKKSSIGMGGGSNNTNKSIGNLQELFQNNTYRSYNPNLYSVGRFGGNGINKNHSIGGALTHNFNETTNSRQNNRITINYNASGTDARVTNLSLENRTTIQNPLNIREEGNQHNRGNRHELGINYIRTNSYSDNLSLNGSGSSSNNQGNSSRFVEVRDTAGRLQSTNNMTEQARGKSDNTGLNLSFGKSDRENPLKRFHLNFYAHQDNTGTEREVQSIFRSYTDLSKSTSYNRIYAQSNKSRNVGGSLDYSGLKRLLLGRFNLYDIHLNFGQQINYSQNSGSTLVRDYDSASGRYSTNSNISNQNSRTLFTYTPSLMLSRGFSKASEAMYRDLSFQLRIMNDFKTDKNESSVLKRNLDRSFRFLRYEGNINLQHHEQNRYQYNLSLNYGKNYEYPSIDQLYTIVDDINVYHIMIGNPDLKNKVDHNLSIGSNFNTQKPKSIYSLNGGIVAGYSWSLHPITDSIINDPSGKRVVYITNADQSRSMNVNYRLNIARKIGKNNFQLMYQGHYNNVALPNYIDRRYNISETGNLSNQFTVQFSLRSILTMTLTQSLQQYKTRQTAAGLTSFTNKSNTTRAGITLNHPKNFSFGSTADYFRNSNLDKPTMLWNAFANYRFLKQQGELKFSAMDILKQYQNISNSVNPYGTITRVTNGLQQYFLLTFSYYPRKFGKTEIKRQTNNDNRY